MKEGVMFLLFVIAGLILAATTCIFEMVYLLSSGLLAQRLAEGDIVVIPVFAIFILFAGFACYLIAMIIRGEVKR